MTKCWQKEHRCSHVERHMHKNVLNNDPWAVRLFISFQIFPLWVPVYACFPFCLKEIGSVRQLGKFETKIMGPLSKIKSQEVQEKDTMKAKYVCGGSVKKRKICAMTAEFWKLFKNHDDWA